MHSTLRLSEKPKSGVNLLFLGCFENSMSSKKESACCISYDRCGDPLEVLYERNVKLESLKEKEVLVNFRASPINPSDLLVIKGIYPFEHNFPYVGGNEGAGYVCFYS